MMPGLDERLAVTIDNGILVHNTDRHRSMMNDFDVNDNRLVENFYADWVVGIPDYRAA